MREDSHARQERRDISITLTYTTRGKYQCRVKLWNGHFWVANGNILLSKGTFLRIGFAMSLRNVKWPNCSRISPRGGFWPTPSPTKLFIIWRRRRFETIFFEFLPFTDCCHITTTAALVSHSTPSSSSRRLDDIRAGSRAIRILACEE